jgi:hippurate hydrolase
VVGIVRGRSVASGRWLGLRADMDALPMLEQGECDWRSARSGLMHGCGHDGHTAMLVGAARYLAETRQFDGTAVLIFQPGEEGFAGAKAMVDDGLFERFPVQSVFAMHNWPAMAPGTVGLNDGAMMAAADRVTIRIIGKGGHGAHPYQTVDPVLVAAHIITAAQSIVSRNTRAIDAAVLSLCAMQAGDLGAMSVVPGEATLVGTVRTFDTGVQALVERRLAELCTAIAQGFGAQAEVRFERIYPATVNSRAQARFAGDVAERLVGAERLVRDMEPSMGAEDFSFMLQAKPGAYLRIGQGAPDGHHLHNSRYDFNDDILPLGAALHAGLVEQGMPLAAPTSP